MCPLAPLVCCTPQPHPPSLPLNTCTSKCAGALLTGGGGSGGGGGGGASGDVSVREALATIIQMLSQQAPDSSTDSSTVLSEQEYEDQTVLKLPAILLLRCGLEVVRGVDLGRADLAGQQWDFCAPVLLSATAPHPNGEGGVFEIFPSKPCYVRPEAVAARHLTLTKSSGQESPPAAHYLAILEMTVTPQWTRGSGGSQGREGLLARLEKRLTISLDRAYSLGFLREKNILELVAVVGVVAPAPYSQSVQRRMSGANAPPLLKKMMDASRFVYIRIPRASTEGSP